MCSGESSVPNVASLGNSVAGTARLRREALGLPAQALHLLVEMAPLEAQLRSRLGHAAAGALEGRLDLLPLELTHRLAQPAALGRGALDARKDGLHLLGVDGGAAGHDPEPLDDVPQLAHVAGEGVMA